MGGYFDKFLIYFLFSCDLRRAFYGYLGEGPSIHAGKE